MARRLPPALRREFFNVPNLLTYVRIAGIPFVLVILGLSDESITGSREASQWLCFVTFILFGAAAITDYLDGWIARRTGQVTLVGKLIDPIADTLIVLAPLGANSAGWIFTEMGRQPWIVFGQQQTANAVSPLVSPLEVWISMLGFTLVYAALAFIEVRLLLTYIRRGAPELVVADPYARAVEAEKSETDAELYFAY